MLTKLAKIKRIAVRIAPAGAALLLAGLLTTDSGSATHLCAPPDVRPVLDFTAGAAEGVALSLDGDVFVGNINTGEIWRAPHGDATRASLLVDLLEHESPFNFLLGLEVTPDGTLYAAVNALLDPAVHGVWKVEPGGTATRAAAAPAFFETALNDIARDPEGNFYVSDSLPGEIWRLTRHGDLQLWSADELLKGGFFPELGADFGVNGLAYHAGALYGAVTLSGRIVRVAIGPDGNPGEATVVVQDKALIGIDGIELDALGNPYVVNNFANIVQRIRATDGGVETVVAGQSADESKAVLLSAPAGLAISSNHRSVYVTNLSTSAVIPQPHAPALVRAEFPLPIVSRGCGAAR